MNKLITFKKDKTRMSIQLHQQFLFTQLKKYITSYIILKILSLIKMLKEK